MKRVLMATISAAALLLPMPGYAQDAAGLTGAADILKGRPYSPYADRAFPTNVYFGDTHVHTGISPDAGGSGTRLMPRDAYRLARGEQITSNTGQPVKLSRPFDFYMITDHSDAMGAIIDILKGTPNIMADPDGRQFHEDFNAGGEQAAKAMYRLIGEFSQGKLSEALNYQPGNPAFRRVWDDIIRAAEEFNDPGVFTTFIAFEWTSLVSGNNLHRNVIFRDGPERAGRVVPYTTTPPHGSSNPRDLWKWLQNYEDDGRRRRPRHPAQRQPVQRHDVRHAGRFRRRRGLGQRLRRNAPEMGAPLRGHPDEGRRRSTSRCCRRRTNSPISRPGTSAISTSAS